MLTDIFSERYKNREFISQFAEMERRFLVQSFRIIEEQLRPYWLNGNEYDKGKSFWTSIESLLSMELGVETLAPRWYNYTENGVSKTFKKTPNVICKEWMLSLPAEGVSPDDHLKDRVSFIELAFRKEAENLHFENQNLPTKIRSLESSKLNEISRGLRIPGNLVDGIRAQNATRNKHFNDNVDELNSRFTRAGLPLNYHNGFIQISSDDLAMAEIEKPLWAIIGGEIWNNVDLDMKEAIDRRDNQGRDPAFYAAKSLESAIKIVAEERGLTTGKERGASNFIDNLSKSGFISNWEASMLKSFFSEIRNPMGHGAGRDEAISLTNCQTNWAIENAMSWIKSIVIRFNT